MRMTCARRRKERKRKERDYNTQLKLFARESAVGYTSQLHHTSTRGRAGRKTQQIQNNLCTLADNPATISTAARKGANVQSKWMGFPPAMDPHNMRPGSHFKQTQQDRTKKALRRCTPGG